VLDNPRPLTNITSGLNLWQDIRKNKKNIAIFVKNLSSEILNHVIFRHYPGQMPGSFNSKTLYSEIESFPSFEGNNIKMLRRCKLLVVDYIASSFGEALIINTPTIMIFRLPGYSFPEEAHRVFTALARVGIVQESMEKAVSFINKEFSNIEKWWQSDEVQKARLLYLKHDADVCGRSLVSRLWSLL
jgi:putative transferase (TIGR04331 family)